MQKYLYALFLTILINSTALANDLEHLVQLQQHGDIASLTKIAQTGNYNAQILLIKHYETHKDQEKQFYWIKEFAKQGNDYAQNALGAMYLYGIGVEQYDAKRAIELFKLADKKSNANAQYNLGMIYLNGMGVPKNKKLAKLWFNKACNNGDENACKAVK